MNLKKQFNSSVRWVLQPVVQSDSRSICTAQHAQNSVSGRQGWQAREGEEEGKRTAFLRSSNSLSTHEMVIEENWGFSLTEDTGGISAFQIIFVDGVLLSRHRLLDDVLLAPKIAKTEKYQP